MGDAELLEALGRALAEAGWRAVPRYDEIPVRLRIFHPTLPVVGETVSVTSERGGAWFRSSTGRPLAPCRDLPRAVAAINATLGRFLPTREPTTESALTR
ncbi:hypothetical protein [Spirillospora sp. NPDC029432]|uniref:hypothetical protein n=1 Tax=Spirillospora sp. NPDC029432 TaxID=3154599 RepID=UPI003455D46E